MHPQLLGRDLQPRVVLEVERHGREHRPPGLALRLQRLDVPGDQQVTQLVVAQHRRVQPHRREIVETRGPLQRGGRGQGAAGECERGGQVEQTHRPRHAHQDGWGHGGQRRHEPAQVAVDEGQDAAVGDAAQQDPFQLAEVAVVGRAGAHGPERLGHVDTERLEVGAQLPRRRPAEQGPPDHRLPVVEGTVGQRELGRVVTGGGVHRRLVDVRRAELQEREQGVALGAGAAGELPGPAAHLLVEHPVGEQHVAGRDALLRAGVPGAVEVLAELVGARLDA